MDTKAESKLCFDTSCIQRLHVNVLEYTQLTDIFIDISDAINTIIEILTKPLVHKSTTTTYVNYNQNVGYAKDRKLVTPICQSNVSYSNSGNLLL